MNIGLTDGFYIEYLKLIKAALDATKPAVVSEKTDYEMLCDYSFSNLTDQMLFSALGETGIAHNLTNPASITPLMTKLIEQHIKAIKDDDIQRAAYEKIATVLTVNGIDVIPIKGVELKKLYPAPHMRRMCDIDIVVDTHGKNDTLHRLMLNLGYSCVSRGRGHHDIYHKYPILNIEIHHREDNPGYFDAPGGLLPDEKIKGVYHLIPEDTYVLLLRHQAKHLLHGGLGVRAVCDLYVLRHRCGDLTNNTYVRSRLEEFGLVKFAETMMTVVQDFFIEDTPKITPLGRYVLTGHTYGNRLHSEFMTLTQTARKSKAEYLLKKILPSAKTMRLSYPSLKKYPFLLPACWIARGFKIIITPERRKNLRHARFVIAADKSEIDKFDFLAHEFGLDRVKL